MVDQSYINNFPKNIILYGGTGQAKVLRPIVEYYNSKVVAVFDDTPKLASPFPDVKIYRGFDGFLKWIKNWDRDQIGFAIAIGNPHGSVRINLHEKFVKEGLRPVTISHNTAWIAKNAVIGPGVQIMPGAVIMPEAKIGRQSIINTKASVDHECILEDGTEVSPGATLCGCVHMEINSWVGAGATVLPRIKIGKGSIVGAGAVVTKDVPPNSLVAGIPAKVIKKINNN